jgi:hypothetical protein
MFLFDLFLILFHKHYWAPPRKWGDGYYMICYECGKRRKLNLDFNNLNGEWVLAEKSPAAFTNPKKRQL